MLTCYNIGTLPSDICTFPMATIGTPPTLTLPPLPTHAITMPSYLSPQSLQAHTHITTSPTGHPHSCPPSPSLFPLGVIFWAHSHSHYCFLLPLPPTHSDGLLCPFIQTHWLDLGEVCSQATMNTTAVYAHKDAKCDGRPIGICRDGNGMPWEGAGMHEVCVVWVCRCRMGV